MLLGVDDTGDDERQMSSLMGLMKEKRRNPGSPVLT
jgi:hypothetical protein